jgi:hypothetical protein
MTVSKLHMVNRMRMSLRRIRLAYIENQKKGKHPKDTGQLAKFDEQLEKLDAKAKSLPTVD